MKNQKGFTLIELLVVISIIGVLSSVVMVSLNNARERARDAVRKSDLAQLHRALELYYLDYDQYPSEGWCDSSIGSCGHACPCDESDWNYTNTGYIGLRLRNDGYYQNLPKDPINNSTYYYYYEPNCNQGVCVGFGCCDYQIGCRLEGGGSLIINSLGD